MSNGDEQMTTIATVHSAIAEMDPELDSNEEAFKVAVVLLSGLVVGTDVLAISRFSGLNAEWVALIGSRLTANGIWKDGEIHADWDDEESGGVAFWIDCCVGQGLLERAES